MEKEHFLREISDYIGWAVVLWDFSRQMAPEIGIVILTIRTLLV